MFCLFEIIIEVLDPMDPMLANLSVLNLNSPRLCWQTAYHYNPCNLQN